MSFNVVAPIILDVSSSIIIDVTNSLGTTVRFSKTSGSFFPFFSASIEDVNYENIAQTFVDYMSTNVIGDWTYTFDPRSTQFFFTTIGGVGANFQFKNSFSQKLFGLSQGTTSSQINYTSSQTPNYIWRSTEKYFSGDTKVYEGQTIVKEKKTDDGRVFSLSNEDNYSWLSNIPGNYKWQDWSFIYEPISNIFNEHSSSTVPYTWQTHLENVRSYRPWVMFGHNSTASNTLYDDRLGTYKIRAEGSLFESKTTLDKYYGAWSQKVETRLLSTGSDFGRNLPPTPVTGAFNPSSVSDLFLWLESDTNVHIRSDGLVDSWTSLDSGAKRFSGSLSMPKTTTFNGKQALFFSQSNNFLYSVDTLSLGTISSSYYFVYSLANTSSFSSSSVILASHSDGDPTTEGALYFYYGVLGNPISSIAIGTPAPSGQVVSFPALNSGSGYIHHQNLNSIVGTYECWQSASFNAVSTSMNPLLQTNKLGVIFDNPMFLGQYNLGDFSSMGSMSGSLMSVIIYKNWPTAAENTKILNYLSNKWGISI